MQKLLIHKKLLATMATIVAALSLSLSCYAASTQVTIKVVNCIPGKTLYPRIYSSGMSGQPAGDEVIPGPPAGSPLGTCGGSAQLTNGYADAGDAYSGISGIVLITGLNGGSLIYNENQFNNDSSYYPNATTALPSQGQTFWVIHGASLAFISNSGYKTLPSGVTCPSNSSPVGPVCMSYEYVWHGNILAWKAYPELVYIVYVYPPAGGTSQDDQLPNLPSAN
jgi:hypothetical protein